MVASIPKEQTTLEQSTFEQTGSGITYVDGQRENIGDSIGIYGLSRHYRDGYLICAWNYNALCGT
ncbi:hypothetical protein D3C75_1354260 [compost metagenome]